MVRQGVLFKATGHGYRVESLSGGSACFALAWWILLSSSIFRPSARGMELRRQGMCISPCLEMGGNVPCPARWSTFSSCTFRSFGWVPSLAFHGLVMHASCRPPPRMDAFRFTYPHPPSSFWRRSDVDPGSPFPPLNFLSVRSNVPFRTRIASPFEPKRGRGAIVSPSFVLWRRRTVCRTCCATSTPSWIAREVVER